MSLVFHNMVSIEEAKMKILKFADIMLEPENINIEDSVSRILAQDIESNIDSPPFDRAEVDGYAVSSQDVEYAEEDHPVILNVEGMAKIGEKALMLHGEGNCIEIATGALVPSGADSIVMVEYTKKVGDKVAIYRAVVPGENISQAGSDIMRGDIVLRKNSVITARELGILASVGLKSISAKRRLNIAIFSTGNELVKQGTELQVGEIYDTNGLLIKAILEEIPGVKVDYLGIVKDNYDIIKDYIFKALEKYDIILTSGSTSAGEGDLVYKILYEFDDPGAIFHGVKVKPGKPTLCAIHKGKILIGLPGFPVSALMIVHSILIPTIYDILEIRHESKKAITAELPYKLKLTLGKTNLVPVNIIKSSHYTAYPVVGDSGSIYKLNYADGYIETPDNREFLEKGEPVKVTLFSQTLEASDLVLIGSHDPGVDLLINLIPRKLSAKIINIGSMGGVIAISRGESHISGVHLLDKNSLRYNEYLLDKYGLSNCNLITGYKRMQGIVFKKQNPFSIKSIKDIVDQDLIFINRNQGSGTRTLIDYYLEQIYGPEFKNITKKIRGYKNEAKTHSAVGVAIAQGRADAGVAIEQTAYQYDLGFIPLKEEHYDFLILKENMENEYVQLFLEALKSEQFKKSLESNFRGYRITDAGKIIK
ncbi:MAG: molybdopterin biosynthesis protein [Thermoplasmata archaeon]